MAYEIRFTNPGRSWQAPNALLTAPETTWVAEPRGEPPWLTLLVHSISGVPCNQHLDMQYLDQSWNQGLLGWGFGGFTAKTDTGKPNLNGEHVIQDGLVDVDSFIHAFLTLGLPKSRAPKNPLGYLNRESNGFGVSLWRTSDIDKPKTNPQGTVITDNDQHDQGFLAVFTFWSD
jgi:hypothetical protein